MSNRAPKLLALALVSAGVAFGAGASGAGGDVTGTEAEPVQGKPAPVPQYGRRFTGARLASSRAGVAFNGDAFVRISCPKFIFGFCYGSITLSRGSTRVGRAPLGVRTRDAPAVRVRLSPAARSAARRGGLRVTARIVSEDGLGRKVTRRQSLSLRRG